MIPFLTCLVFQATLTFGIGTVGFTSILFGLLDKIENGKIFLALSFTLRLVQVHSFFCLFLFLSFIHSAVTLSSRSFYLHCLAKGVFSPLPPYHGCFLSPLNFIVMLLILFNLFVPPYAQGRH